MEFYIFSNNIDEVKELVDHHYSGALLIYNTDLSDFFTQVARTMNVEESFKYMVAIRPYAISPQYLCMINNSINNINKDRLEINFISGWAKEDEKESGGILGYVNDSSSKTDKSNYLIEYIDVLEKYDKKIPDYYVSVADESMVSETLKHDSKLLINYPDYVEKSYDISNRNVMVYLWVALRETEEELDILRKKNSEEHYKYYRLQYFTYQQFNDILIELTDKGIKKILLYAYWDRKEKRRIHKIVKEYKEKEINQ
jgi:hypothetical protein